MNNGSYDDCETYQTTLKDKHIPIRYRERLDSINSIDKLIQQYVDDEHEIVEAETEEYS